jgi:hypothetical protein
MTVDRSWLNGMRAEVLAKVYLTPAHRVEVIPVSRYSPGLGYDLLVRVTRKETSERPEFGVAARDTRQPLGTNRLIAVLRRAAGGIEESDLPLCLFVFNVQTEDGYFRWLLEPVVEPDGQARLVRAVDSRGNGAGQDEAFGKLDDEAVRLIVERVVRWQKAKERAAHLSQASD